MASATDADVSSVHASGNVPLLPLPVAVEPAPESFEVGVVVSELGVVCLTSRCVQRGLRRRGARFDGTPDRFGVIAPATSRERDRYRKDPGRRAADPVCHQHPSAAVRTVVPGVMGVPVPLAVRSGDVEGFALRLTTIRQWCCGDW